MLWIPDGHLYPTVPNRCNYIHWLQHLSSNIIPNIVSSDGKVRGFNIGTGANCIYPFLVFFFMDGVLKEGATNEEITTTITLANAKKFIDKLHQEGWIFIMRDLDCNRECKCLHQASVFQLHLRAINLSY
ncbi:Ribosomal RNA large subunit methyltransferase F [Glycine soja]